MPKLIIPSRKLTENDLCHHGFKNKNSIKSIKINANCNKISILCHPDQNINDNIMNIICVYDIEKDECATFKLDANLNIEDHIWDQNDGRFMSILWRKILPPGIGKNKNVNDNDSDSIDSESDDTTSLLIDGTKTENGNTLNSDDLNDNIDDFNPDEFRRVSDSYSSKMSLENTRKESMLEMTHSSTIM